MGAGRSGRAAAVAHPDGRRPGRVGPAPASVEPRLADAVGELLAAVLESAAVALDNALRLHRAEALSVTDDLTQLYNSRYLNQSLRREVKRATRNGRPLSLLFVDLDGFKGGQRRAWPFGR